MIRVGELFSDIPRELKELFAISEYPWEIVRALKEFMKCAPQLDGFSEISKGVFAKSDATIAQSALIIPPAIICSGAEIRHGAYLRGNVYVGEGCVVGNSTEIKNSILLPRSAAPHYNYVGDSILGAEAHLGAGAVTSNLKADKSNVKVHADKDYETGMRKLGAIVGDKAEIGCGCILNPGTVIGRESNVYPALSVRGAVAPFSIMKAPGKIIRKRR